MSDQWKLRLRKILFWLSGAACGAGGTALGLKPQIQQGACVVNSALGQ